MFRYVRDVESSVVRPLKELKGFEKKLIRKGATERFRVLLDADAFSFYDIDTHAFRLESGIFEILAGGSSASLPLSATIEL